MSILIDRKALKAALTTLRPAVAGRRSSLPICRLVKITPTDSGVTLATNNLELAIEVDLEATIDGTPPEAVGVDFADLAKYVIAAKQKSVLLHLGKHSVLVRQTMPLTGNSAELMSVPTVDLPSTAAAEFMTPPEILGPVVKVDAKNLKATAGRVVHAASKDETRYNLNGVYVAVDGRRLVATDGHQLATAELAGGLGIQGAIVPLAWWSSVTRLKPLGDDIEVQGGGRLQLAATIATRQFVARIVSRLVDGEYPNYKQVMPDRGKAVTAAKVDRVDLLEALEKVAHAAPERSRACKITVTPLELLLETSNPDTGSASSSVEISGQAKPCAFGVNLGYAQAALEALGGEHVTLYLQPDSNGTHFSPLEFADASGAQCIVMPMRM